MGARSADSGGLYAYGIDHRRGLVLLVVCALLVRWVGGAGATRIAIGLFIPLWLIIAAVNLWFGVARAGYSVAEELPVFAVISLVPVLAAVWLWWRYA
ncbi:MAG: hypothetical protein WAN60_08510 [Candidatus Sulfotelmatobacter sp.]